MKKLLSIILMTLMMLPMMAGKTPKQWNFQLNEDGECVMEQTFPTSRDATAAIRAVKSAVNKQTFEERRTINQTDESITYSIKKNTKTRYNPFAGNFNEAMIFQMEATYTDGQVVIRLYDFALENKYEGYGKKVENDTFSGKISQYEESVETAATSKGKAKKEAESFIEETNDSLNTCQEELDKLLAAIKKALK